MEGRKEEKKKVRKIWKEKRREKKGKENMEGRKEEKKRTISSKKVAK